LGPCLKMTITIALFDLTLAAAVIAAVGFLIRLIYLLVNERGHAHVADEVASLLSGSHRALKIESLADFERDLPPGSTVVVLAHTIEEPKDSLRAAVQDNFQQGINYIFLVSESQHRDNLAKYADFFKAIYTIAERVAPARGNNSLIKEISFEKIFVILPLTGEWKSWPYVLYSVPTGEKSQKVFVFRGNQRREGLAEQYVQLEAIESEAFLNAIKLSMRGANHEVFSDEIEEDFDDGKITKLRALAR
jgi:hypothetical protein